MSQLYYACSGMSAFIRQNEVSLATRREGANSSFRNRSHPSHANWRLGACGNSISSITSNKLVLLPALQWHGWSAAEATTVNKLIASRDTWTNTYCF